MPTLDWLNRDNAFRSADRVPTRVLRPHTQLPVRQSASPPVRQDDSASGNLLIHGDNLEALKALLPFYRGQVKCIFIDPPYNTKSAFEHYDDNLEHSQWLSMMLPRLQLLRDLLSEDGSIWVTIDDNEGHYLKVMMDEVFGRKNFVANVFWEKKFAPQNDAHQLSINHDHVLLYAKRSDMWRPHLLPRSEKQIKNFKNPDGDARGSWLSSDYTCAKTKDERPNLYYGIWNPFSGQEVWPSPTRVWAFDRTSTERNIAEDLLYWGVRGENERPRLKKFPEALQQGMVPTTFWRHDEVGNNQDAKKEILVFDAVAPFTTPKPERLIQRVLQLATQPNDLVLDSFLGSGTTAAVAHKMGRRWIGIEMGAHALTHCLPRLQKVLEGEQGGISQSVGWQGGGGFQVLSLGAPLFDAQGDIHPDVHFADLAAFIWMRETGTALAAGAQAPGQPLIGIHRPTPVLTEETGAAPRTGTAYYLLFNGILGDRRPAGGNVLTSAVLQALRETCWFEGPKVIYGEACRLGEARLAQEGITFRQLPHAVPR